jgi:class 3 adenylate cyclase
VTFLFTDVEGSTANWEQHPDSMGSALATHDAMLRSAIGSHGGVVFATGGDGFAAAFSRADAALRAAIEAQALLAVAVSMAFRSPSSSPPRGHGRCVRPRSLIVSTTCSAC